MIKRIENYEQWKQRSNETRGAIAGVQTQQKYIKQHTNEKGRNMTVAMSHAEILISIMYSVSLPPFIWGPHRKVSTTGAGGNKLAGMTCKTAQPDVPVLRHVVWRLGSIPVLLKTVRCSYGSLFVV